MTERPGAAHLAHEHGRGHVDQAVSPGCGPAEPGGLMSQEFGDWLAQVGADDATGFVAADLPAPWRAWMEETFREWGALSATELTELAQVEQARLGAVGLEDARRLLPAVIADATSVGMTLDVRLELDGWANLRVLVRYEPGGHHHGASGGGLQLPANNDPDLLASLADEVQEVSMERDQVNIFVWPLCPVHRLGGHAIVVADRAVWSCNGAGGHVISAIGELAAAR
jgi:hypothetical protein